MRGKSAYRLPVGDIAHKWQALTERRRDHFVELYRSGRWRRYYSEETFRHQLSEVTAGLAAWDALAKGEAETSEEVQAGPPARLRAADPTG